MPKKVFFIEDNNTEIMVMKLAFSGMDQISVSYFKDGKSLLSALSVRPDIVVADLQLPDIEGTELIEKIREESPTTEIIVISAQESVDTISEVQNMGVFNYVVKNERSLKYLRKVIEDLLKLIEIREQNDK